MQILLEFMDQTILRGNIKIHDIILFLMEPGTVVKELYASLMLPPAPVWVPNQWPLALSVMSANDKSDNERGAVHTDLWYLPHS